MSISPRHGRIEMASRGPYRQYNQDGSADIPRTSAWRMTNELVDQILMKELEEGMLHSQLCTQGPQLEWRVCRQHVDA